MTVEAAPAQAPAAAPPEGSQDRAAALIEKHVKAHQATLAADPAEETAERTEGARPRGEDGKFLPAKGKEKAAAKNAEPRGAAKGDDSKGGADGKAGTAPATDKVAEVEPPQAAEGKEPEVQGSLGKARRLVSEGKIGKALELIGLSEDKLTGSQWAGWRAEKKKITAEATAVFREAERKEHEIAAHARELEAAFRPMLTARQAFEAEDYEEAFKHAFGIDWNDFNQRALRRMHSGDLKKDPAVVALTTELQTLKDELKRRDQEAAEREQTEQVTRAQASYLENLKSELAECDDPAIARAAAKPSFVTKVRDEQRRHYDPETDTTIPASEAAELVLERARREWEELHGDSSPAVEPDRARTMPAATDRAGTPVRRGGVRAPTSLSRSEAADTTPAQKPPPGSDDLIRYYEQQHRKAAYNGV